MGFGLGVLRLAPSAFWGMTLRELAAAMKAVLPERPSLGREGFAELMKRYPDRQYRRAETPPPTPPHKERERVVPVAP